MFGRKLIRGEALGIGKGEHLARRQRAGGQQPLGRLEPVFERTRLTAQCRQQTGRAELHARREADRQAELA